MYLGTSNICIESITKIIKRDNVIIIAGFNGLFLGFATLPTMPSFSISIHLAKNLRQLEILTMFI